MKKMFWCGFVLFNIIAFGMILGIICSKEDHSLNQKKIPF